MRSLLHLHADNFKHLHGILLHEVYRTLPRRILPYLPDRKCFLVVASTGVDTDTHSLPVYCYNTPLAPYMAYHRSDIH